MIRDRRRKTLGPVLPGLTHKPFVVRIVRKKGTGRPHVSVPIERRRVWMGTN
jgi:hypothetical protein